MRPFTASVPSLEVPLVVMEAFLSVGERLKPRHVVATRRTRPRVTQLRSGQTPSTLMCVRRVSAECGEATTHGDDVFVEIMHRQALAPQLVGGATAGQ